MNKVAIIYWSQTGNTEMMAEFIAQGLRNKAWTVDLYTISDFEINQISMRIVRSFHNMASITCLSFFQV